MSFLGFLQHKKTPRYEHVAALDVKAQAGENALLRKLDELESRVRLLKSLNSINDLSEDALEDLGGPHRV